MKRSFLKVYPAFWIIAVLALVIIPIKWIFAWMIAVLAHEFGHYILLKIFQIPLYHIAIKAGGIYMHTATMTAGQEIAVSAGGLLSSLVLVLCSPWIPYTACCAFFHLMFNLLPFFSFDGGRILWNCIRSCLNAHYANITLRCLQFLVLVFVSVLAVRIRWGIMALIAVSILLARSRCVTFPCKRRKQIVQWSKQRRRGTCNERTASKDLAYSAKTCPLHRR